MPAFAIILLLLVGSTIFHHSSKEDSKIITPSYTNGSERSYSRQDYKGKRTITQDSALDEHWDEIKEYINGSESIEVYSHKSGSNYTLDADISNGEVESIHFPNGGYIYINADLDSNGTGEGYGSDGYWDVEVDSSLIEDATEEWASDNGYTLSD